MPFAPEDTKVWESSEVMAEFEKIAAETDLLGGGPPEAHMPIPEKTAEPDPAWEEEPASEQPALPPLGHAMAKKAFASHQSKMLEEVRNIARGLADDGNIKGAYRTERALAELEAIVNRAPAEGGE